jgi:hypothetical protein
MQFVVIMARFSVHTLIGCMLTAGMHAAVHYYLVVPCVCFPSDPTYAGSQCIALATAAATACSVFVVQEPIISAFVVAMAWPGRAG